MKKRIVVIGSSNTDMIIKIDRIPRPGETVIGGQFSTAPGGKGANQAVAAARLGAQVTFVGKIGPDAHGARLRHGLEAEGIATDLLAVEQGAQSGLAVIVVEAGGENRILVYSGANMAIRPEDVAPAFARSYDAVMLNLEIPEAIVVEVCRKARERDIPVVLDAGPARPFDLGQVPGLEILSPNESEALALTGIEVATPDDAEKSARVLAEASRARYIVIKMGEQGALAYADGQADFFPAHSVDAVDTTAAGDAFTAALTLHYVQHGDIAEAVKHANAAGALAVTKLGAQPSLPTADEVTRFLGN